MGAHPIPLSSLVLLAACAATGGTVPKHAHPPAERFDELKQAERQFLENHTDWPASRDRLVADPATQLWIVDMLILHALVSYQQGGAVTGNLESLQSDTLFTRALADFKVIGARAEERVFTILLGHRRGEERAVGIQILQAIGEPALPRLLQGARSGLLFQRRASIEALGGFTDRADVAAALRSLAEAPEWEIRAEVMEALAASADPASVGVLLKASRADADAFVRRKAVSALRNHRTPESAQAIVEFMQSAIDRADPEDVSCARDALRRMAGRDLGDTAAWRRWIAAGMPNVAEAGR